MDNFSEAQLKKWCQVKYVTSFDGEKLFTEIYQKTQYPSKTHIILHGLGGSSQSTLLLVDEILKKFPQHQVIIYDLRGHGLSSIKYQSLAEIETIEAYHAHDLESLISFFRPSQLVLWGHSFGGIILQAWHNLFQSSKNTQFILLNSYYQVAPLFFIDRKKTFTYLKKVSRRKHTSFQPQFNEDYQFAATKDLDLPRILNNDIKTLGKLNFILSYFSILGWKNPHATALNQPHFTFVYGTNDLLIQKPWQQLFMKQLTQARLKTVPCNHHQILSTQFKELADLIK